MSASNRLGLAILLSLLVVGGAGAPVPPSPSAVPHISSSSIAQSSPERSPDAATSSSAPANAAVAPDGSAAVTPVRNVVDVRTSVLLAPGSNGGLYVSMGAKTGTVLMLLDSTGRARPGWPVTLKGWDYCSAPAPSEDGSVRIVCIGGNPETNRAFAFDASGKLMAGWPVEFPGTVTVWAHREQPRVIDGRLVIIANEWITPADPGAAPDRGEAWLVSVAADGSIRTGMRVSHACCSGSSRLAADGTAVLTETRGRPISTRVIAFDLDGVRDGWPVSIDGWTSAPAFGPNGSIYLAVGAPERGPTRTLVFDRAGRALPVGSDAIAIATSSEYVGAGMEPGPPIVADDGTAFIVETGGKTTVFGLDPAGRVMTGWPYTVTVGIENRGSCSADSAGCGYFRTTPQTGPGTVLYLLHAARDASIGGSAVAIGRDGKVRPGWPVVLRRKSASFSTIVAGTDGMVYALAVEPEGNGPSATVLAITRNGTVSYRTTVVEP
jgi:hypothetical protein